MTEKYKHEILSPDYFSHNFGMKTELELEGTICQ